MLIVSDGFVVPAALPLPACVYQTQIIDAVTTVIRWSLCMRDILQTVDLGIPQHDERRFIFPVQRDGIAADLSGVEEITWILAPSVRAEPIITKTLSGGVIQLTGNDKFYFSVTSEEAAIAAGQYYHEARIITAEGLPRTVFAGVFTVTDTRIGDSE